MNWKRLAWAVELAALAALTLWTFWDVRLNPFHFDDDLFLQSPQVTEPGDLLYLLKPAQPRQLTYLTFYWNYRLGGSRPASYHLVNLLLHLANVFGLYLFVRLLLQRNPDGSDTRAQRWLPLAAGAIFAVHPVQSEAVNYAYQRSTLLAALFSLAALISFLKSQQGAGRTLHGTLAGSCFVLAVFSKESSLAVPLVWGAYAWATAKGFQSLRQSLLRCRRLVVVLALATTSFAGWLLYALYRSGERTAGLGLAHGAFRYFASQIQVFATYLRLLLWPSGLSIDHDFPVAPFLSIYGILCTLLLAGLLILVFRVRTVIPAVAFLGCTFFLFLVPTSSIVPSADLLFEHRLYAPMIAASTLLAWGSIVVFRLVIKTEKLRQAAWLGFLCALLATYSALSRQRTFIWGDNIRLWEDTVSKAPGKARPHYNLAIHYMPTNEKRAREEFLKTLQLSPNHAAALYNLGWLEQKSGRYDSAREHYRAALAADQSCWQARHNLGNLGVLEGKLEDAIREFEGTIRLRRDYWPAFQSLATLQLRVGRIADAISTLQELKALRSDLLEARYLNAYALIELKRYTEADEEIRLIAARDSAGAYRQRIEALEQHVAQSRTKKE